MRLIDLDDSAHTYYAFNEFWSIDTEKTVDAIPIDYIKDTIKRAEHNSSMEYAYYLYHLLRVWAERKEA